MIITSQDSARRPAPIVESSVLSLGRPPPSMVCAETANRDRHRRNHAVRGIVGLQHIFGTEPRFPKNVRHPVGILRFALIKRIVVLVTFRIDGIHKRKLDKTIGNRLAFLKVVATIVPAARHVHVGERTILQVTRLMEPRFGIAATVHAIELEHRIAQHGIHPVADDKRRRILVPHLDTEALVFGQTLGELTLLEGPRRASTGDRIASVTARRYLGVVRSPDSQGRRNTVGERFGESPLPNDIASRIDYLETRRRTDVIDRLVDILRAIAGLVDAYGRNIHQHGIDKRLVQRIRNHLVRRICRRSVNIWQRVTLGAGNETVREYGTVPRKWPYRPY